MKKEEFIERFETAIRETYIDNVGVYVMIGDASEPEIIVNPRANFESKLKYYEDAYDDDMCLKYNKDIKIVDVKVQVLRIYPNEFIPKPTKNSVLQEDVDNAIAKTEIMKIGDKTTFVQVILKNGFVITDSSSCVDPVNFVMGIGVDICMERIKNKIWELLGFQLQSEISKVNLLN